MCEILVKICCPIQGPDIAIQSGAARADSYASEEFAAQGFSMAAISGVFVRQSSIFVP
jgi:hypothetical protein